MSASLDPAPRLGSRAWATRSGPTAFTASCSCTSPRSRSSRPLERRMPAFRMARSSGAPPSALLRTFTPASDETSTPATTRTPSASSGGVRRRQTAMTSAPRCFSKAQSARPIPRFPPVTSAVVGMAPCMPPARPAGNVYVIAPPKGAHARRGSKIASSRDLGYDPPKMVDAVAAFRDHLRSEKRASPHTLRAYLSDVEELGAFARQLTGRAPTLSDLDSIVCRSYLASLHGRNDAATIGRKLSSLRAFFRFLVRRRLVASSPVAALRAPKRSKRLPAFLGKDDVGRLLDGGARSEDPPELAAARARDEALFEIIYAAGLRVSEACNLDVDDLTTSGASGEVKVRQGKGRKDRIVPVGRKAIAAVAAYLVHRTIWMAAAPPGSD